MSRNSQRGSAIIMLFIAVALFGLLSFAFLQGSRSNLNMMTSEAQRAAATQMQDCMNVVDMAAKRLQGLGCGNKISYNQDGSNTIPGAPTDGTCSIYHSKGGGVKFCGGEACSDTQLGALIVGQACGNAIFAGTSGGNRIYVALADSGTAQWNNGLVVSTTTGASSNSNGLSNTNTLIASADAGAPYGAATMCRALGADWYLPSIDELDLLYSVRNMGAFNGTYTNTNYWNSTEAFPDAAYLKQMVSGGSASGMKYDNFRVRCVMR